jgi:hypothetical protein
MSRYTKFPQGIDQKMPLPPSIKNDFVFTPNHENLHANSSKQPFSLLVDSRDRNIEMYPNPNNYVIQVPRYKDVLSVEIIGADIPHSGFNIDNSNNTLYIAVNQEMFIQYYNGVRIPNVSYIEVVIPPGYYEASDLASKNAQTPAIITTPTTTAGSLIYQSYYNYDGPTVYNGDTGILATAFKLALNNYIISSGSIVNIDTVHFYTVLDIKTLKYTIVSTIKFAILNRDTDTNFSNGPIPDFFHNQTPAQAADSYLGANNNRFNIMPRCAYNVLGFEAKNYFPRIYNYQNSPYPLPTSGINGIIDGAFDRTNPNYVQIVKGENFYWPPPHPVTYNTGYNPINPCNADLTGLPESDITLLSDGTVIAYSAPCRANMTGEKYIVLDIPELNYRDQTNIINNQFYCRILLDTPLNITPLSIYYNQNNFYPTSLSIINTVKAIKGADIGNNRGIKYFSPSLGVLSKLTIRWLKHDGTPYDFQGQDHSVSFEILTIKQTGDYFG